MESDDFHETKSGVGVSKWIIGLVVIAVVLVGVYFLFSSKFALPDETVDDTMQKEVVYKNKSECVAIEDDSERDGCYLEFVKEDIEYCNNLFYSDNKDDCIYEVALNNEDRDICKKIKYYGKVNECLSVIERDNKDADDTTQDADDTTQEEVEVPSEEKDFEFGVAAKCGIENRIYVEAKNIGIDVIEKTDWSVSRVDGVDTNPKFEKDVSPSANTGLLTLDHYSKGEHIIELGWEGNVKEKVVSCDEDSFTSEIVSGSGKMVDLHMFRCRSIREPEVETKYVYFSILNIGNEEVSGDNFVMFEIDGKNYSPSDVNVGDSRTVSWSGENTDFHDFRVQLEGGNLVEFTHECK